MTDNERSNEISAAGTALGILLVVGVGMMLFYALLPFLKDMGMSMLSYAARLPEAMYRMHMTSGN